MQLYIFEHFSVRTKEKIENVKKKEKEIGTDVIETEVETVIMTEKKSDKGRRIGNEKEKKNVKENVKRKEKGNVNENVNAKGNVNVKENGSVNVNVKRREKGKENGNENAIGNVKEKEIARGEDVKENVKKGKRDDAKRHQVGHEGHVHVLMKETMGMMMLGE